MKKQNPLEKYSTDQLLGELRNRSFSFAYFLTDKPNGVFYRLGAGGDGFSSLGGVRALSVYVEKKVRELCEK